MSKNLRIVLGTALLFGISTGVLEFILPLFLTAQGISYANIGWIFALSGLAVIVVRIYMGGLSDRWGRKPLYGLAFLISGGAIGLAAISSGLLWQAFLKMLRDTAALTRDTLHPIVIYEEGGEGFLNRIGKFRGIEFLLQAVGTAAAAIILAYNVVQTTGYSVSLLAGGAVLIVGAIWWFSAFREHPRSAPQRLITLRELLNFDLHRNLLLMAAASAIFAFGVAVSHSFYMQLFFRDYFHVPDSQVAIIMVIHRFTIALPMLVVGNLPLKNLKVWYVNGYIIQGITVAISPFLPGLWLSAGVFLLHDLIGAGIWSPIQAALIQRYSRDATRGMEVGKVLAWGSLGGVFGAIAAGQLASIDLRLPFFISGVSMVVAAIPLIWLNLRLPAPDEKAPVPVSADALA